MSRLVVRPQPHVVLRDPVHLLAFGFGAGLAPKAPGTFGTLVGVPLFLALYWLPLWLYLLAVVLLFGAGIWLCGESARRLGTHDHPGIVWDEIVGFLITMTPVMPGLLGLLTPAPLWFWLLVGFGAFRAFDIAKPAFIRRVDAQVSGGLGIMLDDVLAGVCAAAVLVLMTLPTVLFIPPLPLPVGP